MPGPQGPAEDERAGEHEHDVERPPRALSLAAREVAAHASAAASQAASEASPWKPSTVHDGSTAPPRARQPPATAGAPGPTTRNAGARRRAAAAVRSASVSTRATSSGAS